MPGKREILYQQLKGRRMMNTTNEEKKQWLNGYIKSRRKIQLLDREIQEIRFNYMYAPAQNITDMPKAHKDKDLSEYAARLRVLENRLDKLKAQAGRQCEEIIQAINALDNENERDVIYGRYIQDKRWEEICTDMRYSWRQIHRFHSSALCKIKLPKK